MKKKEKFSREKIKQEVLEGFKALLENHGRPKEDMRSEGITSLGLSAGIEQVLDEIPQNERGEILREIEPELEKWAEGQGIDYKKVMIRATIVRSSF